MYMYVCGLIKNIVNNNNSVQISLVAVCGVENILPLKTSKLWKISLPS